MAAPSLTKSINEKAEKTDDKDRVGLRLYNAIAVFDVYVVAESGEDARHALLGLITEGEPPSEIVAVETVRENAIRESWRDQSPFVAEKIPEDGFAQLKGKSTAEVFRLLYAKTPK